MSGSFAYLSRGGRFEAVEMDEAEAAFGTCQLVWIHLDGRDEAALDWLRRQRDIPDVVSAALTAVETRPRLEEIGDGALLNLRGLSSAPKDDPDALVSIRLWCEQARVLSLGLRPLAALPVLCQRMKKGLIHDPGDLVAALSAAITDALDPKVAELGDELDLCEAALDEPRAFAMRREIARSRADAINYRRFVVPQRQALEGLAALEASWLQEDDRLHLREAADRVARMAEELEAVRERAALLHEQITDLRAEQIDRRSLLLSIVALIFLPLTFITGLLGMNVGGVPFARDPGGFWWVCLICTGIGLAITGWFATRHWFGK